MGRFVSWAGIIAVALASATACDFERPLPARGPLVDSQGVADWSVYHTAAEAREIMLAHAARHPDLVELDTIGQSIHGQDLVVAIVTNRETGAHDEKPAMWVDGGIHARELTSSQVALHWMDHLLEEYGEDPEVTALVDERTFYIHPKFNPDGSDLVLEEDAQLRSTPRPVDLNEDGVADSDPAEDLTGNGRILQMRVEDPDGGHVLDDDDPRILRERGQEDEGPFYRVLTEGVDRNRDGEINSDGLGGIDMNRNWPRNWDRWHVQPGAGDFPLSEPETRAVAEFVNDHRNIGVILHGHTSGAFVFRLPSAMDPDEFDDNDEALVEHLGEYYTDDTGRPIVPSATDPVERRHGTFIQWAYSDHGIVAYVPEYSAPPGEWVPDYEDTGEVDEADWHRFNEEELGGRYFSDWEAYDHPDLGEVEIGGWWSLFWGRNPPHDLLEEELELQVPWFMYLARKLPELEVADPRVAPVGGSDGEERVSVQVTVRNAGFLPTNVTERGLEGVERDEADEGPPRFQVARSPLVVLEVEGGEVVDGPGRKRVGHLAGSSPHSEGVSRRERTVDFQVEPDGSGATVRAAVHGEKAGTVRTDPVEIP